MDMQKIRIDNLKELLEKLGGAASVARKFPEFDPSYASQLLNGHRSFGEKAARKMELRLNLPANYFDTHTGRSTSPAYLSILQELKISSIPLFSFIQAGDFKEAFEDIENCEFVTTDAPVRKHTYALKVTGDSMEPIFKEGMIVVVEPELSAVSGDYVIAKNGDNEATLKQLIKDGSDWLLKPLNPQYPTKDATKFDIVGVVVQLQSITKFR